MMRPSKPQSECDAFLGGRACASSTQSRAVSECDAFLGGGGAASSSTQSRGVSECDAFLGLGSANTSSATTAVHEDRPTVTRSAPPAPQPSGAVGNNAPHTAKLEDENRKLRAEIDRLRGDAEASAKRAEAEAARLRREHERLRDELAAAHRRIDEAQRVQTERVREAVERALAGAGPQMERRVRVAEEEMRRLQTIIEDLEEEIRRLEAELDSMRQKPPPAAQPQMVFAAQPTVCGRMLEPWPMEPVAEGMLLTALPVHALVRPWPILP